MAPALLFVGFNFAEPTFFPLRLVQSVFSFNWNFSFLASSAARNRPSW